LPHADYDLPFPGQLGKKEDRALFRQLEVIRHILRGDGFPALQEFEELRLDLAKPLLEQRPKLGGGIGRDLPPGF
jgi:hypothetical protein